MQYYSSSTPSTDLDASLIGLDKPCPPGTEVSCGCITKRFLEILERTVLLFDRLLDGTGGLPSALRRKRVPVEGVVPHLQDCKFDM